MGSAPLTLSRPVSPWLEMGAYEGLWTELGAWFKSIADKFKTHPGALPSDFYSDKELAYEFSRKAQELLRRGGVERFGVRIHGAGDYPEKLRKALHPIEFLYYQGWWELVETRSVSIVGTREPSPEGKARAAKLAKLLVEDGFTITSGLAKGIDTTAHLAAIEAGGLTVAVIGTPLSECYPKENRPLQDFIASNHLLISQVPVCRYAAQNAHWNSRFFPERNITMAALTEATIIIEAGETSGTLIQARAALAQKKKLFILENCFNVPGLKWPHSYQQRGAIRVKDYDDIRRHLGATTADSGTPSAD